MRRIRPACLAAVLTTEEDREKVANEIGVFILAMDMIPSIAYRTFHVDALHARAATAVCTVAAPISCSSPRVT